MTYREAPAAAGPVVVAFRGKVFGLEPKTGKRLWSWAAESTLQVRLAVDEGRVYALVVASLTALDLATGAVLWTADVGSSDTLLATGGLILVGGMGSARAFTRDGKALWEDGFPGKGMGSVALAFNGLVAQADEA